MSVNVDEIKDWIAHDPDPATVRAAHELLAMAEAGDADARAELEDAFSAHLSFGTAGLRGKMGPGTFRMNRAVVRRAAAGLCEYLKGKVGEGFIVVIGYDARYNSRDFATDTAAIVTAAGGKAYLQPRQLPTPMLAHAVRAMKADAGVMVTASHNPAQDNGYKVYLGGRCADEAGNGVQIVPPADKEIAACINAAPKADEVPLADSGWESIPESVIEGYIDTTIRLIPDDGVRDVSIVYTAMHGVGTPIMAKVLEKAGFKLVTQVTEQCSPDPDFPTVAFPNPEEAGALDMAISLAEELEADIVIASDPDADRCSAAVPTAHGWRQLSGDNIGSILGEFVAQKLEAEGAKGTLACSIVSSRLLEQIARSHGQDFEATLTGFKWIARAHNIAFGYEEAIGFCVNPTVVKDKDGISAGLLLAYVAAQLAAEGKTLEAELDRLYAQHGVYLTGPVTVRVEDLSIIPRTMAKLRKEPPTTLAGSPVVTSLDLSQGTDELPPTDALIWETEARDRVVARPSGTEPKVKCYLEVIEPVTGDLEAAKAAAAERLERLKKDISEAMKL